TPATCSAATDSCWRTTSHDTSPTWKWCTPTRAPTSSSRSSSVARSPGSPRSPNPDVRHTTRKGTTPMDAYVYDAIRTPFGRLAGGLAEVRPDDLAAHVITHAVRRAPALDPARIDEVVFGN